MARKNRKQELPQYKTYADLEDAVLRRADEVNKHGVIETPETAEREEALRQTVRGKLLAARRERRASKLDTKDLDEKIGRITTKGDKQRDAEAAAKFLNMDRDEAIIQGISTLDNKYLRGAARTVNALLKTAEMTGMAGAAGAMAPTKGRAFIPPEVLRAHGEYQQARTTTRPLVQLPARGPGSAYDASIIGELLSKAEEAPVIREKIADETARRMGVLKAAPRDWSKAPLRAGRGTAHWQLLEDLNEGYMPSPSMAITPADEPWSLGSGYGHGGATYGARIFFTDHAVQPSAARGNAVASADAMTPAFRTGSPALEEALGRPMPPGTLLKSDAEARTAAYEMFYANPEHAKDLWGFSSGTPPRWLTAGRIPPSWRRLVYARYSKINKTGKALSSGNSYLEGKPFRDIPFSSEDIGLIGLDAHAPEEELLYMEKALDKQGIRHLRYTTPAEDRSGFNDWQERRNIREQHGFDYFYEPEMVREEDLHRYAPVVQDAKGGRVRKDIRADEAGGDVAPDADPAVSDKPPVEEREPSPEPSAPARIIINPKVFKDKRDGLCVAYNEAFRVLMEMNGFDPQAEPTEEQRKFFSDTAYADDERMLRRTILARICTFDDSVRNPTDEQLDEALEFLETVMEIGAPQSEEEQANVQRIHDMIAEIRKAPRPEEQPAEQPVESEAPPVAAVGGGYSSSEERWADRRAGIGTMQSRDENGRLSGSNWMRDENGRLPGSATEARASEEARAEGDNLKEGLKFDNPKDKAFGGEAFPGDPATPLGVDEDGGEAEIPGLVGDAPMAQAGAAAPAENPGVTLGRRADGSLAEGSLRDQRDENGRLIRADGMGGKTGVPKGSAKTDDTYVTNTAVVMPEAEARKMGVVTQGFERVGKDQVAIPFEDFRSNGTVVDAAELLAESYGSKEAAEAAVAKSMANRAKRYPGGVPSEAAMADPESVPVVPAGSRPGPWDEAYLSHAARAGHWNLKTVKSGAYLRTAGYIPGLSLGLIPTRVLGTSSPSIEVRRMLNSQVGETGESAGNGRIVTISDTANPNKPGWYASDEGYRAAALGSVKGWLTANGRMPGEGEDLAAVMAAAHRDRTGLKRGKIDKNGKDFLAAVAKAYEAERGGSASKKDKEILAAARDMDMWGQVVGARRYDRYSTTT